MKAEITEAANFLANLLRSKCMNLNKREQFRKRIEILLKDHFQQHWFPDKQNKGSAYRCIRINHNRMDPLLCKTGIECGFNELSLREYFPKEFTLWIDPEEVSYRIGENGSICIIWETDANKLRRFAPAKDTPKRSVSVKIKKTKSPYDPDGSCSPMSISPPSPTFNRVISTCKDSLHGVRCNLERRTNYEIGYVAS